MKFKDYSMKFKEYLTKKNILIGLLALFSIGLVNNLYRERINPEKSTAYKRAKKKLDPDLYLTYRLTDRILESNQIKRPIRVAVRKGAFCDMNDQACQALQLLPDIDKSTNFDIWARQVVNTMAGSPNAIAYSNSGTLFLNIPLMKDFMGKPTQLACVISHELAHITQNHSEEQQKEQLKYDLEASKQISNRVKQLHDNQTGAYVMAAIFGGMASAYSGDNSSINQVSTQIQFDRLAAQMAAPEIGKIALNYSPVIGKSINETKGLAPEYLKKAFKSIDSYLRDSSLKLLAFSRGHEYEADLLGLKYVAAAGFNPEECIKVASETMPHDQDKIIARLLPEGTNDPGKEDVPIFINKEEEKDNSKDKCDKIGLKGKEKFDCLKKDRRARYCDPIYDDCDEFKSTKRRKAEKVPEAVMEMLSTHPSWERREKAIRLELKNKKLFNNLKREGKIARENKKMRDWKYDEDSNSVVISGILKSPKDVGRENTGTTGIDVDKFLD